LKRQASFKDLTPFLTCIKKNDGLFFVIQNTMQHPYRATQEVSMTEHSPLSVEEQHLLQHLRSHRRHHRAQRQPALEALTGPSLTWGQQLADKVAATVGSWRFIMVQSALIVGWIAWNTQSASHAWDPYPFILLNLVLSFQAAYTAPAIMMSQNRLSEVDRLRSTNDYEINVKAELEIELLHQKIDLMREQDIRKLEEALLNVSRFLEKREEGLKRL
jgi:uncharacterized membrane protein